MAVSEEEHVWKALTLVEASILCVCDAVLHPSEDRQDYVCSALFGVFLPDQVTV